MITIRGKVDDNDLAHVLLRGHDVVGATPAPIVSGMPRFNTTQFLRSDGQYVSVFHTKLVYYEHRNGEMRPLSEVTLHHGNRVIILNDKWTDIHPRYLQWLAKRQRILGTELSVPTKYGLWVHQTLHDLATGHIGLTTTTKYSDPDPETTTCDGITDLTSANSTWSALHDAATSSTANATGLNFYALLGAGTTTDKWSRLARTHQLFDTSVINTDTISSAVLSMNCHAEGADFDASYNFFATAPASNTDIVAGDYDGTSTTKFATDIAEGSFPATNTYTDFTFVAAGISAIAKTGISKFSQKTSYDTDNAPPTWSSGGYAYKQCDSAEAADVTKDPKLVVVHAAGSSGPANLKSYNTNLKANIKSINTNLIANVKSLDTNV